MSIVTKIEDMFNIVGEIGKEEPGIANILTENLTIALNTIKVIADNGGTRPDVNIDEQLDLITEILGISLEDVVLHIVETKNPNNINKEADQETLDFITSQADVDDYETFLDENKVKDNLNFLIKEL